MKADQCVIIEVIYLGHLSISYIQAARKLGTRGTLYLANLAWRGSPSSARLAPYNMVAEIVAMIASFTCTRTHTYRMRMHPETPVYGVHMHVN